MKQVFTDSDNGVWFVLCQIITGTNGDYHHFDHQGKSLHWRHNDHDCVSNHQPHHCLLKRLFRRRLKKTSKLRVIGLCVGNSPETGEFPAQMASNAEKNFHLMTSSCYQRVVICIMSAFCSGHIFFIISDLCVYKTDVIIHLPSIPLVWNINNRFLWFR